MVFGHSNFDRYELRSEDNLDEDVSTKQTIFKKAWMPKRWKFFRTSGKNRVFNFKGSSLASQSVSFKLPKWMRPYLRDSSGNVYPTTPLGYTALTFGSGDYLTMGGDSTVMMRDADDSTKTTATTFPQLSFSQDGVEYALRWNEFAKERKIARGGYRQNWGYARAGTPVRGAASVHDMNLELDWGSTTKWWLIAGAAVLGSLFWFSRKRKA